MAAGPQLFTADQPLALGSCMGGSRPEIPSEEAAGTLPSREVASHRETGTILFLHVSGYWGKIQPDDGSPGGTGQRWFNQTFLKPPNVVMPPQGSRVSYSASLNRKTAEPIALQVVPLDPPVPVPVPAPPAPASGTELTDPRFDLYANTREQVVVSRDAPVTLQVPSATTKPVRRFASMASAQRFGALMDADSDESDEDTVGAADAAPSDLHAVEMASSGGWSQVPTKTPNRSARHSREDGSVAQAPTLSRFQLYVTGAKGLSEDEVRRMFKQFTKHEFSVDMPPAFDGAAFVKFRTSKAADAAVMQSPISHKGLAIRVQYLDLARQSHNVDHNLKQERHLRKEEHRYSCDEL
jgi:hypothetical protein